MSQFDDVMTDRRVNSEAVERFVVDTSNIGAPYPDAYTVATTSGTTGTRGTFLLDRGSLAVAGVLTGRMLREWLTPRDVLKIFTRGGRIAIVSATGGHFASAAAAARLRKTAVGSRVVQLFGVHTPLPDLTAELNRFRPAVLAPYATTAVLLAAEQESKLLRIHPALVVLAAEGIADTEFRRVADAFGAKVGSSYAATECPFPSYRCYHGWMHVNADWAILEPVEADYSPTPPGQLSHSVLLTNLANRVQPILRYDLGDSVLARPDRCECGSPLPAIRVQGRSADVLTFPDGHGDVVAVTALALSALLEGHRGVELAQIVQTEPAALQVRMRPTTGVDIESTWRALLADLVRLFEELGATVSVQRASEPPQPSPGGKYRPVLPLSP